MPAPTRVSLKRAEKQARDALELRDKAIQMHILTEPGSAMRSSSVSWFP